VDFCFFVAVDGTQILLVGSHDPLCKDITIPVVMEEIVRSVTSVLTAILIAHTTLPIVPGLGLNVFGFDVTSAENG